MTLELWVEHTLRARGLWNDDGVSRKARARRCRGCRAVVLAGLDGDLCGCVGIVDMTPLTAPAETIATGPVFGRTTYRVRWWVDHYEIDPRTDIEIAGSPAHPGVVDVLPSHVCGSPISTLRLGWRDRRTSRAPATDGPAPY